MTTGTVKPATDDAVAAISRRVQCKPAYVVRGTAGNRFYAAKWRFPPHRTTTDCVNDHILCCAVEGASSLGKITGSKAVRKHANAGAVLMLPSGDSARYTLVEATTLFELYISPALFDRFSEEHSKSGRAVSIQPFFVEQDPWLKAYFEMLASEVEMYGERSCLLDSLLLNQSQQLLFSHLLRRYCDLGRRDWIAFNRSVRYRPLRPPVLKRVTDFVQENLSADIHLSDLAGLVYLSERHFIRAFHATTGTTPYQYVLEKRLQACAERLRGDDDRSVAEIAKSMRFNSPSHFTVSFRARYGVTPRRYRRVATSR
jgi:AraC family transcriptional regulator